MRCFVNHHDQLRNYQFFFFKILCNYFVNCVILYLAITSEERVHKFQWCPARTEASRGEVLPHRCAVPSKRQPLFVYLFMQTVLRKAMLIEFILLYLLTLTDNMKIILDSEPGTQLKSHGKS